MKWFTRKTLPLLGLISLVALIFYGCESVKPFQKAFLNDEDMDLGLSTAENPENAFQSYREGATGANGGKVGGGCGCN
ncbi:MAG: hypothetical protein Kow0079_06030 [Vicingaceae bacterium]